jgi:hypothetical protein
VPCPVTSLVNLYVCGSWGTSLCSRLAEGHAMTLAQAIEYALAAETG